MESAAPSAHNTTNNQSRAGTAENRSRANTADTKELGSTLDGVVKEVLSKEEEEFLKLESVFITELGLSQEQLPAFARPPPEVTTT